METNRRRFLGGMIAAVVAPFMPKLPLIKEEVKFPHLTYSLGTRVSWELLEDTSYTYGKGFAELLAPGVHQVFTEWLDKQETIENARFSELTPSFGVEQDVHGAARENSLRVNRRCGSYDIYESKHQSITAKGEE